MSVPEQLLENLQNDVRLYEEYLKKIANEVIKNKISQYPIFIAYRDPQINLGRPILLKEQSNSDWSINASLLEEFVRKQVIKVEKAANFKSIYKDPKKFICLFVISGEGDANFAFYPYHISEQ